jgi:hypothetical protein
MKAAREANAELGCRLPTCRSPVAPTPLARPLRALIPAQVEIGELKGGLHVYQPRHGGENCTWTRDCTTTAGSLRGSIALRCSAGRLETRNCLIAPRAANILSGLNLRCLADSRAVRCAPPLRERRTAIHRALDRLRTLKAGQPVELFFDRCRRLESARRNETSPFERFPTGSRYQNAKSPAQ